MVSISGILILAGQSSKSQMPPTEATGQKLKENLLHAYLHKPLWTSWPVAFPSSSKGIKKKFHILNLRINHKLETADFIFSPPQIQLQLFSGRMIFFF